MTRYRVAGFFVAVALLFLPPGSAPAAEADARAAWERKDYDTAFSEFMPLAIAGDPRAQLMIAMMHHFGWGTPQDYGEAARWYRLAADQEAYAFAQAQLGWMYRRARGLR